MDFFIFIISLVGLYIVFFTINNIDEIKMKDRENRDLVITLTKYNVDNVNKDEIISRIKSGDYSNICDIVDNIRIN